MSTYRQKIWITRMFFLTSRSCCKKCWLQKRNMFYFFVEDQRQTVLHSGIKSAKIVNVGKSDSNCHKGYNPRFWFFFPLGLASSVWKNNLKTVDFSYSYIHTFFIEHLFLILEADPVLHLSIPCLLWDDWITSLSVVMRNPELCESIKHSLDSNNWIILNK